MNPLETSTKKNSDNIQSLLKRCTELTNSSLILVTHDLDLAKMCDTQYELVDGQLNRNETNH